MNLHVVDFLDIQFNLKTNSYKPYMKPNSVPVYINKNSNHPTQVLKDLPKTIVKRISTISLSKKIVDNSKTVYEETKEESKKEKKKKKKCNMVQSTLFNNVKTNIGKVFFKLLHAFSKDA